MQLADAVGTAGARTEHGASCEKRSPAPEERTGDPTKVGPLVSGYEPVET